MMIDINIERLRYLLSLYRMKDDDLLSSINLGLKRLYKKDQVFSDSIDMKVLKKIDSIFNRGYSFYSDPTPIQQNGSMSVFFRKESFSGELNFSAIKVVDDYEILKNYLASLDILSDNITSLNLPKCTKAANPRIAAERVRKLLYPLKKCRDDKSFLKSLIDSLANYGVLVVEFLEAPNKKEKANIDGFFLAPNFIGLKRQYYKREIFTLLHEVGHCILNKEDVESQDVANQDYSSLSAVERWCSDFAYYFLIGDDYAIIDGLPYANGSNDYHFDLIKGISDKAFISRQAIYTRLLFTNRLSRENYANIVEEIRLEHEAKKLAVQAKMVGEDGKRKRISAPQPIYSPLFLRTLSTAYIEGNLRASDISRMKIPAKVVEGLQSWW